MKPRRVSSFVAALILLAVPTRGYPPSLTNTTFSDPQFLKNMDRNLTHLGFILKLLGKKTKKIVRKYQYFQYIFLMMTHSHLFFALGGREDYCEVLKE
jgi:hypothetical protein